MAWNEAFNKEKDENVWNTLIYNSMQQISTSELIRCWHHINAEVHYYFLFNSHDFNILNQLNHYHEKFE